jgi:2-oxoglutarate ferredoxin oxidoreductase subunit gamma
MTELKETRIRLAGIGGQGLAKAGYILGKAVAVHDHNEAIYTQEYGPESRGGASASDVVVSPSPILEPFFEVPDILIAMVQAAVTKYRRAIRPHTQVLVDADLVAPDSIEGAEVLAIPATRIAEGIGIRAAANVVMLGFLAALHPELATVTSLEEAVRTSVPPKTIERNLEAFRAGHSFGRELSGSSEAGARHVG